MKKVLRFCFFVANVIWGRFRLFGRRLPGLGPNHKREVFCSSF